MARWAGHVGDTILFPSPPEFVHITTGLHRPLPVAATRTTGALTYISLMLETLPCLFMVAMVLNPLFYLVPMLAWGE